MMFVNLYSADRHRYYIGESTRDNGADRACEGGALGGYFLDIFRTLNQLLLTYNSRTLGTSPVIPHPYVTDGMLRNLALLIGEHDADGAYHRGFIDAVRSNFEGDGELVRERMQEEGVPQILRAAVEAMIEARRKGRKLKGSDAWATAQLARVSLWIERQGFTPPGPEDIRSASMEYTSRGLAA